MQETWVQSLGWEDPLEKGIATQSSCFCLGNPMDRGAWGGYSPWGSQKSQTQPSDWTTTPNGHCSTINNSQFMESSKCPQTNEQIKKIYKYTMEYYSAINGKEIGVICSEMDEPRVCHIEWSTPEREKQVSYISTCIRNLEKWCWWAYLPGRNREWTVGRGGRRGRMDERAALAHTLPCVRHTAGGKLLWTAGSTAQGPVTTQRAGMGGWLGGLRGSGHTCTYSWFTLLYSRN